MARFPWGRCCAVKHFGLAPAVLPICRAWRTAFAAAAALGAGPGDLMNDLRTFGYLFETMAVRDLRVYADAYEGTVSHYLDKNGLECDAIAHLPNGTYGLVEIKLGGESLIEEGATTLNSLAKIVDSTKMKEPAFKMVLTAVGEFAYRRKEDGVIVCPISALRP